MLFRITSLAFVLSAAFLFAQDKEKDEGKTPEKPIPQDQNQVAMRLATQGKIGEAINIVRKHLAKYPKDPNGYGLIGQFLAHTGKTEDAIKVWTEGAAKTDGKHFLMMFVARTREQQGTDGPNIVRRGGTITALPSKGAAADAAYSEKMYIAAIAAYKSAAEADPKELEPLVGVARVQTILGRSGEAVKTWQKVVDRKKDWVDGWLGIGVAQQMINKSEEAHNSLSKALKLNPRNAMALQAMAEFLSETGKKDEAAEYQKRLAFFQKLPPFTKLDFKEENVAIVNKLNDMKLLVSLSEKGTAEAYQLLATLCWQHPHNKNEDYAFTALDKAGEQTSPLLRDLIRNANSTCTIRGAGHILARRKDKEAFSLLMPQLYEDVRFGFEMDIAGALDNLGDARAVEGLITMMAANDRDKNSGNVPFLQDRFSARARATLALGAFEKPSARKALQQASQNPAFSPFAYAALYRLGKAKEKQLLEKMITALGVLEGQTSPKPDQNVLVIGEKLKTTTSAKRLKKYLVEKANSETTKALLANWDSSTKQKK